MYRIITGLLDIVELLLPSGSYQWDQVTNEYNKGLRNEDTREADALKNKFNRLRSARKPTGDPTCPPDVQRAKRIQQSIEDKQAVVEMDDDENTITYERDNGESNHEIGIDDEINNNEKNCDDYDEHETELPAEAATAKNMLKAKVRMITVTFEQQWLTLLPFN